MTTSNSITYRIFLSVFMENSDISQLDMEITLEEYETFLSLMKELETLETENAQLKEQNLKLRNQIQNDKNFSVS